ncbi:hypothetical protein J6E80_002766 [Enterococcus faecalis]|nr:hypothetical protein [Enterococcus faecalis]
MFFGEETTNLAASLEGKILEVAVPAAFLLTCGDIEIIKFNKKYKSIHFSQVQTPV